MMTSWLRLLRNPAIARKAASLIGKSIWWILTHPDQAERILRGLRSLAGEVGRAAREVWSYLFPSKTDEPPPREAADVQRQEAAPPPQASHRGYENVDFGPDAFLKEDRRKPPAQAEAPRRESVDFGRRAGNSPSGPLVNGRGRPRAGPL